MNWFILSVEDVSERHSPCKMFEIPQELASDVGSFFISGQPSSNHGNRARGPSRARFVIHLAISYSICGRSSTGLFELEIAFELGYLHRAPHPYRAPLLIDL